MGLWQRFTLIFKSKANKALDKAEDPRETLDYSYQKQLELLQKVRRGVADVATSRKRLELQIQGLAQQEAKLEEEPAMPPANAVVTPQFFDRLRLMLTQEPALRITGRVQNSAQVIHVRAEHLEPLRESDLPAQTSHDFR